MTWTQPICQTCWNRENPGRKPVTLRDPEPETCSTCGNETVDGIYVRKDPKTVPYPAPS